MVQGLNWNNYSPAQIVELKNQGIEVPDNVYEKAYAALSQADSNEIKAESNDNANVSYTIENTADEKNEAKELRAQLESEGKDLKEIVRTFTDKSTETTTQIAETMKEVESFISYISKNEAQAQALEDAANDETKVVIEIVEETETQIDNKADELDFLNEKIEEGTATEDEQTQAETLSGDIKNISGEASELISKKVATADSFGSKLTTVNSNLKDVANKTGKALNNAKDAIELADETQEVSKKLYDKGMKIRTIATAISTVAGGVGGFFAGKALGNKLNDNKLQNYLKENNIKNPDNLRYKDIKKDGFEITKGGVATTSYNKQEVASLLHATSTNTLTQGGGALAGAGLGFALGSLFGGESIEMGENGMAAASKLKDVSNQTKAAAEKVAEQNNISIAEAKVADVSVEDFGAAVADGDRKINSEGNNAQVAENTGNVPETTTEPEDDPTKRKPTV